jgi:thioredoxin 1
LILKNKNTLNYTTTLIMDNFNKGVIMIGSNEQLKTILENDINLIVIKYSAPWCGPCKKIAPFYNEMAVVHKNITFLEVDIDKLQTPNIRAVPTFRLYKKGKLINEFTGTNLPLLQNLVIANK